MNTKVVVRYGQEIDLSYERKGACVRCQREGRDRSCNNMHFYGLDENGKHKGGHCFSCGYTIPSEEHMEKSGFVYEYNEEFDNMGSLFNNEIHDQIKSETGVDTKGYRGIRTDISKWFGVRYQYSEEDGSVVKSLYPCTKNYEITGYKVRNHPKDFRGAIGTVGAECDLFMQFRFKTHSGIILIVGGEIDALSSFQMLKDAQKDNRFDPVAVVSSTIGETSAAKQIQHQYEWFSGAKKIIVAMDNDEAGKRATEAIVEVLPKGRVHVMNLRYKDPNEYLMNGKANEFISDFWAAKPYTPEGVKSAGESFDEIEEEILKPRITLPPYMHKMQEMMGDGIIQGRTVNIISFTSSGKSTHVNRMVYHWIFNSPVTPTIVSLEATAGQYMLEMLSIHLQQNFRWNSDTQELIEFLKTERGQQIKQELCFKEDGSPRFYLIDDRSGNIKDLEKQLEKLYRKHGSKLFVIDVLSDLLRGSSEEYAEDHMHFQRTMNKEGVTFINCLHTRKPTNSADGKEKKVTEYDALGTGSYVQSASYNIVLNRNKLAEDHLERNTTEVDLPKCRGGKTGGAGKWYYDFNTVSCYDFDDYMAQNPELLKPKIDF